MTTRTTKRFQPDWNQLRSMLYERTFDELYQNARIAGARRITVTTEANDHGGTVVQVADNGSGAKTVEPFVEAGRSGWILPSGSLEEPRGAGLLRCFAPTGYTVHTRTGPGAEDAWSAEIGWKHIQEDKAPDITREHVLAPEPSGTRIVFGTLSNRANAQDTARRAAEYLPVAVEVDGKAVEQRAFIESPLYERKSHGVLFGVYTTGSRPGRPTDTCIGGLPIDARLPTASTGDATWTVHAMSPTPLPGIRREDPAQTTIEETAEAKTLRYEAEKTIYLAISETGGLRGIYTETLKRAKSFGIDLPTEPGSLVPWTPTTADIPTRRSKDRERQAIQPGNDNLLIELDQEDRYSAEAMLGRALDVSSLSEQAFKPDDHFEGQAWYDTMPRITKVECLIVDGDERIAIDSEDAIPMLSPPARPRLELRLLDEKCNIVKTLQTDVGLVSEADDLDTAALYVSKPTTLKVRELTDMLTSALFVNETLESALEEHTQFRAKAEHRAAIILEGRNQADLRQVMRVAENDLVWRLNRTLTDDEELRWSLRQGEMHAEIVNRSTGETAARTMKVEELQESK